MARPQERRPGARLDEGNPRSVGGPTKTHPRVRRLRVGRLCVRSAGQGRVGAADGRQEAHAAARDGRNHHLPAAVVAHGAAGVRDPGSDRRVGHDPAVPDRVDQFVPRHQSVAIAREMEEEVEDLRLQMADLTANREDVPVRIDLAVEENQPHPPAATAVQ